MSDFLIVIMDCFNPRPCVRGDFHGPDCNLGPISFNPRPCVRGDFKPY